MFSSNTSQVSTAANYIEDVFSTYLYTGNDATQAASTGINLSTKGGLVWTKRRNGAASHFLVDTVRGNNKPLSSNSTAAQTVAGVDYITPTTTGYTVENVGNINTTGETYASWTFAKQAKFFDVVTYTGDGVAGRTVAHNLGSVPGCMIIKRTSNVADWIVYHRSIGAANGGLKLNTTVGTDSALASRFNYTDPTATEFTLGGFGEVNASGNTYVAYLFAHNAGGFGLTGTDNVISCGSYTGNGSTTGPTVTLGYEPQWVMIKSASSIGNWVMQDVMRGMPVGSSTMTLWANLSNAESDPGISRVQPTATGFQLANTASGDLNANGETYIYIAIRRGPMKTPTTGTSVYNAVAYTGDGSTTREISTSITPDLAMTKGRSSSYVPFWCSRLAGAPLLYSSSTDAERLASGFTNGGFRINTNSQAGIIMAAGSGGTANNSNANGADFINWNFRRAPGVFDVVCWTGTSPTAQNINHNLGVVPELMIVKRRSGSNDWLVYAASLGKDKGVPLNLTDAPYSSTNYWNDTNPTSSAFSVGNSGFTNLSGATYVGYLFASCPGVSKVGSYTGTGATQQINCGFTGGARFVLIRRTDSSGDWYVWDSARGIVSGNDPYLLLNSAGSEQSGTDWVDTHSPGFELSNSAGNLVNTNGGTYIFLAIA